MVTFGQFDSQQKVKGGLFFYITLSVQKFSFWIMTLNYTKTSLKMYCELQSISTKLLEQAQKTVLFPWVSFDNVLGIYTLGKHSNPPPHFIVGVGGGGTFIISITAIIVLFVFNSEKWGMRMAKIFFFVYLLFLFI